MNIPDTKIATILFNFRDYCKTKDELSETLKTISDIGYQVVQITDSHTNTKGVTAEEFRELLDANGLYCCSTQGFLPDFNENIDCTVSKMGIYGCDITILANPKLPEYFTAEGVKRLATELNEAGKRLRERGIRFGYHNHHLELERFTDRTMLDELVDGTDAENVCFELDLHWIQRGGGSPVKWLKKLAGRTPIIHFKDYSILNSEPVFSEIREGNLDWEGILAACEETDVRWYVVEQDQTFGDRNIFESARISFENLKKMGVK